MKLAILGGSFNPVHLGHFFLADTVLSALGYDRVVMVPAYRSPFKPAAAGTEDNARDRLEMLAASIAGDPRLTVDDCELRREGVSYTVDTVADIIRRYAPEGKPGLIIGDDLAGEFPRWYKSDAILEQADIIIARRIHSGKLDVPYPHIKIDNDTMTISSAQVRQRIAAGNAWRSLVPPAARVIIEDRGLYGFGGAAGDVESPRSGNAMQDLIYRVEVAARETLSLERFLHSRSTALLSRDLCLRFGGGPDSPLDPDLGYLAGIAHDLGKTLDGKELLRLAKAWGGGISRLEKEKPALLHGRAAAVILKNTFNVNNRAVLEAVAMHTEGGENMCPLAKVVYIADKIECTRERVDPHCREVLRTASRLDDIFFAVLDSTVSSLRTRQLKLSRETLLLLENMRKLSGGGDGLK